MKYWQNNLPSMFSNQFVSTEVLQTLLDDLYAKASHPANDCVLMLFENSYLARTGLVGSSNTTTQNTWRNNFNLQKGIGCYAPPQDLASQTFLDQSRAVCRYLQPHNNAALNGATCRLAPNAARYRSEDHRKWLRIDPDGNGYAVLDLLNVSNFAPYVAPENYRIPIVPVITCLYHDASPGLLIASRTQVDVQDFASDFNFSFAELSAYFDDSRTNEHNRRILRRFPTLTYTPLDQAVQRPQQPQQAIPATRARANRPRAPVLTGTPTAPPGVNTGWEAEQYVAVALGAAGWTVYDVSRQQLGYDLVAEKGRQTRFIDVKSSLGMCTPTLTRKEWQQARSHGDRYVLAIIENFNPAGENIVFWVPDPASNCSAREHVTTQYAISRTSWTDAVVRLADI